MRITEYLKAGDLKINAIEKRLEIAKGQLLIPYEKITPSSWGYVYEKHVGQILENEGFKITYNGFAGYTDQGIDLIAEKGNSITYIQCKFSGTKKLSKSHIDKILFKASKKLLKAYQEQDKKLAFALIVHSKEKNFRRTAPKGLINTFTGLDKTGYPWLEYFLSHNYTQSQIKVGFREIPMNT